MTRLIHPVLAFMLAGCNAGPGFAWSPLSDVGFEDALGSDPTHGQYWLSGAGLDGDEIVVTDAGKAHREPHSWCSCRRSSIRTLPQGVHSCGWSL